jgi:hypothetical protein
MLIMRGSKLFRGVIEEDPFPYNDPYVPDNDPYAEEAANLGRASCQPGPVVETVSDGEYGKELDDADKGGGNNRLRFDFDLLGLADEDKFFDCVSCEDDNVDDTKSSCPSRKPTPSKESMGSWPPFEGPTKVQAAHIAMEKEVAVMKGTIAKQTQALNSLQSHVPPSGNGKGGKVESDSGSKPCFNCGKTGHFRAGCKEPSHTKEEIGDYPAPAAGASLTMKVGSDIYLFCEVCKKWRKGHSAHSTAEHKVSRRKRKPTPPPTAPPAETPPPPT